MSEPRYHARGFRGANLDGFLQLCGAKIKYNKEQEYKRHKIY